MNKQGETSWNNYSDLERDLLLTLSSLLIYSLINSDVPPPPPMKIWTTFHRLSIANAIYQTYPAFPLPLPGSVAGLSNYCKCSC